LGAAGAEPPRFFESSAMNAATARGIGEKIAAMPPSERPDGVFAANDLIALGLLSAFMMSGLSVPDDIALIGYDDIDYAASAAIPLSSIRQPAQEMGARAAELLLHEIEGGDTVAHQHVVFEPELVVRASTGAWTPGADDSGIVARRP
jgi:LacI family transcriptional regulator